MNYATLAVIAALLAAGAAADRFTPIIGANARIAHFKHERDAWRVAADNWETAATGWKKAFAKSEDLRSEETDQARQAVNETALQCDARVRQARASAKVIREIVNAPIKLDADRCPIRPIVGADRLRDALQARTDR